MADNHIPLGARVKDVITGFTGIATTRSSHITGCDRYGVEPPVGDDGKPRPVEWFDATRLTVIDESPIRLPGDTRTLGAG